jgi:integrase
MAMAVNYPYLVRGGKRQLLCFRRSVPPRLRPIIGKREFNIAFATPDLAAALPRYHVVAAKVENELQRAELAFEYEQTLEEPTPRDLARHDPAFLDFAARARARANAGTDDLGPQAEHLKNHYLERWREEQKIRRDIDLRAMEDPAAFWSNEIISEKSLQFLFSTVAPAATDIQTITVALVKKHRERYECRSHELIYYLDALGEPPNVHTAASLRAHTWGWGLAMTEGKLMTDFLLDDPTLHWPVMDALRAIMHEMAERKQRVYAAYQELSTAPAAPLAEPMSTGAVPAAREPTHTPLSIAEPASSGAGPTHLSAVAMEWINSNASGRSAWSDERRQLCERVIADFIAIAGDRPIADYKKSHGREFVSVIRRLPANLTKRKIALGIAASDLRTIAGVAQARGLSPQDDSNANKKIGIVHQFFRWAIKHYDECIASPVDGMKIPVKQSVKAEKDPFTIDQLNAIFSAPVYTGCKSETHWARPGSEVLRFCAKFWIPLIALFSGMRSGEICQLTRAHIREHQGVHYFTLTKELMLKNVSSSRAIPIHRLLLACGFLDFVASRQDRLFPELARHKSGRFSDGFGKYFARFLKSLSIKTERTDCHSFRHNFVAASDASGMEFGARERMVGHAQQGQAARYGKRYEHELEDMQLLMVRNAELQKLHYPGLNLNHLILSGHGTEAPRE